MKIIKLNQRSKEWHKFRRNHIGASDAPIIMELSPFKSPEELLKQKIYGYESIITPWMQKGIDLEEFAIQNFEKETGLVTFPVVAIHDIFCWMSSSYDGMTLEEDCIVEIKCPGKKDHLEAKNGNIPKKYKAQLQHQMFVADLDFAFYYSFYREEGVVIEHKRDNEFIELMLEKEIEFWNNLELHCVEINENQGEILCC